MSKAWSYYYKPGEVKMENLDWCSKNLAQSTARNWTFLTCSYISGRSGLDSV